jgi:riboflavin biosynthesis pyrimidine reductase
MDRPRCITFNSASVDGRLTVAPGVSLMAGDPRWPTTAVGDPYDWVRSEHDPEVLLEGSGSFAPDPAPGPGHDLDDHLEVDDRGPVTGPGGGGDAGLAGRRAHFLPREVVEAPGRRWFTVVDGRGRVDLQFTEWPDPQWAGWHALVLTSQAATDEHLATLRDRGIPYLVVGRHRVDLPAAMRLLGTELGVRTVVCTGGGKLGGAMLRAGLVDEIDIDVLPVAIGGRGTPALFDAPPLRPGEWPVPLTLLTAEPLPHGVLRLRYAVVRT